MRQSLLSTYYRGQLALLGDITAAFPFIRLKIIFEGKSIGKLSHGQNQDLRNPLGSIADDCRRLPLVDSNNGKKQAQRNNRRHCLLTLARSSD